MIDFLFLLFFHLGFFLFIESDVFLNSLLFVENSFQVKIDRLFFAFVQLLLLFFVVLLLVLAEFSKCGLKSLLQLFLVKLIELFVSLVLGFSLIVCVFQLEREFFQLLDPDFEPFVHLVEVVVLSLKNFKLVLHLSVVLPFPLDLTELIFIPFAPSGQLLVGLLPFLQLLLVLDLVSFQLLDLLYMNFIQFGLFLGDGQFLLLLGERVLHFVVLGLVHLLFLVDGELSRLELAGLCVALQLDGSELVECLSVLLFQ